MAGDRTAIVAGGEGRNTPAAAHVASLALAGRASVASSLHRAARLATGSEHADGLAYPWHRRPPTTLAALRAGRSPRWKPASCSRPPAARGTPRCSRVNEDVHDDNFPDVDAPSPNSVRPSGWDADDIRSTWLHNLAG